MRVVVLEDFQDAFRSLDCYRRLAGFEVRIVRHHERDPANLVQLIGDAEIVQLIQQRTSLAGSVINQLRNVRLISLTSAAASHVDLQACTDRGITVCGGGPPQPQAPAELTWGLILAALRHIPEEMQLLKAGGWQSTVGTSVHGRTLGIYGFGRIGSLVAQVGAAFGMRVLCYGRDGSVDRAAKAGFAVAADKHELFSSSDVLSVHVALNAETRGLITAEDLALMKPTALFVNTSRAGLLEPGALAAALHRGRPGQAAIDVYDEEPPALGAADELVKMPTVTCTPHLGYVERDTYEAYLGRAVEQILAFAGGHPINVLNRPPRPAGTG